MHFLPIKNEKPSQLTRLLLPRNLKLRHGAGYGAESIPDPGTQQTYHTDHHDRYKRKDDRILHKPLASFLWCK